MSAPAGFARPQVVSTLADAIRRPMPRTNRRILCAVLAVHAIVAILVLNGTPTPTSDFGRYYEIAATPGRPYVDFEVEHPIATLVLFRTLAHTARDLAAFAHRVVLVNAVADASIVAALWWAWGVAAAAVFAVAVLPVVDLLFARIDLWSMAAATIAVAAWTRNRRSAAGIAVAAGAALKLWPLMFVMLLVIDPVRRGLRERFYNFAPSGILTFALTAAAFAGAMWLIAGIAGFWEVLTFRGARGWQIESMVGSVLHAATALPPRLESGSWRIGATTGGVTIVMFALAAPACLWSIARGAATGRIGTAWLAGVSSLLILSALVSAQFAGWLAPGAAIAWAEGDRRSASLAGTAILLTGIFWKSYGSVVEGRALMPEVVVGRNAVLAALAIAALRALARPQPRRGDPTAEAHL